MAEVPPQTPNQASPAPKRNAMDVAVEHHQAGRFDAAINIYRQILEQVPTANDVLNNLGVALRASGRHEAAIATYLRSLRVDDQNAGAWSNLGNVFRDVGRFEEAVECQRRSLELEPDAMNAAYNLALVLRDFRDLGGSLEGLNKIVAQQPDNPEFNWDRALTLLYQQNYAEGFDAYDWRLGLARARKRTFAQPLWQGDALNGRTLLLHGEQGFGDMIQFSRFISTARKAAGEGKIVVECLAPLARLLSSVDGEFDVVIQDAPLPPFDLYAPLLSVPKILELGADDLNPHGAYLKPPSIGGRKLPPAHDGNLRVGIVWAGKLKPRDRSAPLEKFLELAAIQGIDWYSLQVGERTADLHRLTAGAVIRDPMGKVGDFADTAAIIDQLDLVITIDTATAHLAGALGAKTWMLLTYVGDWRWLHEGDDCLWYPTMRLFRQEAPGKWDPPFTEVAAALNDLVNARQASPAT